MLERSGAHPLSLVFATSHLIHEDVRYFAGLIQENAHRIQSLYLAFDSAEWLPLVFPLSGDFKCLQYISAIRISGPIDAGTIQLFIHHANLPRLRSLDLRHWKRGTFTLDATLNPTQFVECTVDSLSTESMWRIMPMLQRIPELSWRPPTSFVPSPHPHSVVLHELETLRTTNYSCHQLFELVQMPRLRSLFIEAGSLFGELDQHVGGLTAVVSGGYLTELRVLEIADRRILLTSTEVFSKLPNLEKLYFDCISSTAIKILGILGTLDSSPASPHLPYCPNLTVLTFSHRAMGSGCDDAVRKLKDDRSRLFGMALTVNMLW